MEPAAHTRSTLHRGNHTHTDARSGQKAMGAERTFPREDKESRRTPSLRSVPRYVSPLSGHAILRRQGKRGRGALPLV